MSSSMQRMRLNSDSTIEAAKSQSPNKVNITEPHFNCSDNATAEHRFHYICNPFQGSPNVSIMDQLNRGVKVEGLMLPPGITLTRVDPTSAEGMRAKKESISRVSNPTMSIGNESWKHILNLNLI